MARLRRAIIKSYSVEQQPKKHVVYKIECADSDGTTWTVFRRYSDFVNLDTVLKRKYDLPQLPPKRLFGNFDEEHIEQRWSALEGYLQHLVHSVDGLSGEPVVQRFLELVQDDYLSNMGQKHRSEKGGPFVWKDMWQEAENDCLNAQQMLSSRQQAISQGRDPQVSIVDVKVALGTIDEKLEQLRNAIDRDTDGSQVAQSEIQRREGKMQQIRDYKEQINRMLNKSTHMSKERNDLLGSTTEQRSLGGAGRSKSSGGRAWGAAALQPRDTTDLSDRQVVDMQRETMQEQDQQLDVLLDSVRKQKHIATSIGTELDEQNRMLDDLNARTEQTSSRLNRVTGQVDYLRKHG
eukprot:Clim_evm53s77 gene=Clim_evmTU53s77